MGGSTRRRLLAGTALLAVASSAHARTVAGSLPWRPNEAYPPAPVLPGPYLYLRAEEAAAVDAIVARLIPADELGPGAQEAGVTTFIDRQLAGPYGGHDWLYMQGPFPPNPLPSQGLQSPVTPREEYRLGLAALGEYCQTTYGGRSFAQLPAEEQDRLLTGLEKGQVKLSGYDGRRFFLLVQANCIEGFFADPVYGGNRDMVGWQLVGFPGTRYDYRDVMARPNQAYTLPPVGIGGQAQWGKRT